MLRGFYDNIQGITINQAIQLTIAHAKEYTKGSVKEHYLTIENEELRNVYSKLTEGALISLQAYFQSTSIVPYVELRNDNGKFQMFLSNKNRTKNALIKEIEHQVRTKHGERSEAEKKTASDKYAHYEDLANKLARAIKSVVQSTEDRPGVDIKALYKEFDRKEALIKKARKNNNLEEAEKLETELEVKKKRFRELLDKEVPAPKIGIRFSSDRTSIRKMIAALMKIETDMVSDITGIEREFVKAGIRDYNSGIFGMEYMIDYIMRRDANYNYQTPLRKYVAQSKSHNEFTGESSVDHDLLLSNFTEKSKRAKEGKQWTEAFALASDYAALEDDASLSHRFLNPEGKNKDSIRLANALSLMAERINMDEVQNNPRFKNNDYVTYHEGREAKLIFVAGLKDKGRDIGISEKGMSEIDDVVMRAIAFFSPESSLAEEGFYLQPVEQFSDKTSMVMTDVLKYDLASAKAMYEHFKSKHPKDFPTKEQAEQSIEEIADVLVDNIDRIDLPVGEGKSVLEMAKELFYNHAINKFNTDQYFYGESSSWSKDGKVDYVNKVKRQLFSSGITPVIGVEGGVKETHKHITINDPVVFNALINGETELPDGVDYISEEFAMRLEKSYGTTFGFASIFKMFYWKTNQETGEPTMHKSNAVVLTREYAETSEDLKRFYDWMQTHKIDRVSFKSGVKKQESKYDPSPKNHPNRLTYKAGENGLDLNELEGLPSNPEFYYADNRFYFFQQDLRQSLEFQLRSAPRQVLRYIMELDVEDRIQLGFNEAIEEARSEILDKLESLTEEYKTTGNPNKLKEYLVSPDRDGGNWAMQSLLENPNISFNHPMLWDQLQLKLASKVKKKILDLKVKKHIAVEAPNFLIPLKETRVENGKIVHGEAMISIALKDQIVKKNGKSYVFITRVPVSYHHSTSLVEVVGYLPESAGSVIITATGIQKIAGADNDGDQRHIWARYSDKELASFKGAERRFRESSNKAWDALYDIYNPTEDVEEHFEELTKPINTETVNSYIPSQTDLGSPYDMMAVVRARAENSEGQSTIGIIARYQAVQSFLDKHQITLKLAKPNLSKLSEAARAELTPDEILGSAKIFIPGKGEFSLRKLYEQDKKRRARKKASTGNHLNLAVDHGKLLKLGPMGMVKRTSTSFNALFNLIPLEETELYDGLIKFYNHPIVKQWLKVSKRFGSPLFKPNNGIWIETAKSIDSNSANNGSKWKSLYGVEPKIDESHFAENLSVEKQLEFLNYLMRLEETFKGFYNISELINFNEEAPTTVAELADLNEMMKVVNSHDGVLGNIHVGGFMNSPYFKAANSVHEIMNDTYDNLMVYSNPMYSSFKQYLDQWLDASVGLQSNKSQNVKSVFSSAIQLASIGVNETKAELRNAAIDVLKKLDRKGELKKALVEENGIVRLSNKYRTSYSYKNDIEPLKEEFSKLSEQDKLTLLKHLIVEQGVTSSPLSGNYQELIDNWTHEYLDAKVSTFLNEELQSYDHLDFASYAVQKYGHLLPYTDISSVQTNSEGEVFYSINYANQKLNPSIPSLVKVNIEGKTYVFNRTTNIEGRPEIVFKKSDAVPLDEYLEKLEYNDLQVQFAEVPDFDPTTLEMISNWWDENVEFSLEKVNEIQKKLSSAHINNKKDFFVDYMKYKESRGLTQKQYLQEIIEPIIPC